MQHEPLPPGTMAIVAGLMMSMFLVALDMTIVTTAMPSIVGSLGGFKLYAWVGAVYLLTSAVSTPIYGKLSDLYGRKPVLFTGIGLFLLGSVTSGAAPNMLALIIFRAIQGLGAGAVFPVTITIVGDIFSLEQRARFQGFFSSVWGVSSIVGPLVGGLLVDSVGWRWIFYLNLPFGVLAIAIISRYFHERRVTREHKLDIAGATYLTLMLSAVLLLLIEGGQSWAWVSWQSGALLTGSALLLGLLLREEQHAAEPTIPLELFNLRIIAVASIAMFFAGIVMMSLTFEVPLFTQGVLGQDALHAGFTLAPMSIGWPLAGAFSGRLALRFGYRLTTLAGLAFVVIGVVLLLTLSISSSFVTAAAYCFVIGAGMGLSSTPLLIAVQSSVTWAQRGVATATSMFVRNFGSVVGLAVMGAIINSAAGRYGSSSATNQALDVRSSHPVPPAILSQIHHTLFNGIHQAFYAALVASVIGLIVVGFLPGGSARAHVLAEEPSVVEEQRTRLRPGAGE